MSPAAFICFYFLLLTIPFLLFATQEEEGIALIEKGETDYSNGLYHDALAAYNEAMVLVRQGTDRERLLFDMAVVHYALGENKECQKMLGFLLQLNPEKKISQGQFPRGFLQLFNQLFGEMQKKIAKQKLAEERKAEEEKILQNNTIQTRDIPDVAAAKLGSNELVGGNPTILPAKKYPLIKIGPYVGFYQLLDESVEEFYGKSDLIYGGKLGIHVWQEFYFWFAVSKFKAIGKTVFYEDEAILSLTFLSAFLRYNVSLGFFNPYAGIGFTHVSLKEGFSLNNVTGNGSNVAFEGGFELKINRYFILDIGARLGQMKIMPEKLNKEIDVGGLQAGVSLLVSF